LAWDAPHLLNTDLYVRHVDDLLPPSLPARPNFTLAHVSTSLIHAPLSTLSTLIETDLPSLLDSKAGGSSNHEDGQLDLEFHLRVGATAGGRRPLAMTFRVTGELTTLCYMNTDIASFSFVPDSPMSPG